MLASFSRKGAKSQNNRNTSVNVEGKEKATKIAKKKKKKKKSAQMHRPYQACVSCWFC